MTKPKILFYDIETSSILANVWGLWDQNVALNQIERDWHVLSFCAKWSHEKKVIYADQRDAKKIEDESKILKQLWKLLDEADIVVTQNGQAFDEKKLNARFLHHGFGPPSKSKHIDTLKLAKKYFAFTSNKLEYMTDKFCIKHKKLKHKKYPGFELWAQCMKGNVKAWNEMKIYNVADVLSLEELYNKLIIWDNPTTFTAYNEGVFLCTCGETKLVKNGFSYMSTGKFPRFKCSGCGKEVRGKKEKAVK